MDLFMANHIYIIWQMKGGRHREDVQRDFLKTYGPGNKIRHASEPRVGVKSIFSKCKGSQVSNMGKNALTVDLWSEKVLIQKLRYIHENPVRAGLCKYH